MKHIVKVGEPQLLRRWRLENQSTPHVLCYENIPSDARAELRSVLLREQGFLCANTTLRIKDERKGHIEHLRARSQAPDAEVDYANMVYCHPGDSAPRCKFGAHAKDDTKISHEEFVSPLEAPCETRFAYETSGRMLARNPHDMAASRTIDVLALNDGDLGSGGEPPFGRCRFSCVQPIDCPQRRRASKPSNWIRPTTKANSGPLRRRFVSF